MKKCFSNLDAIVLFAILAILAGGAIRGFADGVSIPANTGAPTFGSITTTGAVNIAEGKITDSTIVSADIKNGTILGADIRTNTLGKANLAAADFGDFTVGADGTCTIDSGAVTDAKVADDITVASTKALSAGSISTTGVVTFAKTATPANVLAAALSNLPTGSTTNAAFITIKIGATTYALPAYAQP